MCNKYNLEWTVEQETLRGSQKVYDSSCSNYIRYTALSLGALAIVISVSSLGLSFYVLYSTTNVMVSNAVSNETGNAKCVDCLHRVHGDHEKMEMTNLPCCERSSHYASKLQVLLDRYSSQLNETSQEVKHGTMNPVSAHKYLVSTNQDMDFHKADHVLIKVNTSSDHTNSNNHDRGVKVTDDGIEILHSGLYFIYSSLLYIPNTDASSDKFPYQTWYHYVFRTRPNSPALSGVILKSVFTCFPNTINVKESVYTAGAFHLKAGDVIHVCLSGQGIMKRDTIQDSSFIGLFMLARDH